MMMCNMISATKANRLYWLGRYTERVYISLHLLRRYYDLMIDSDKNAYNEYCERLGIESSYSSVDEFIHSYMYDSSNPFSLISELEAANDNAIVLREEIRSETLSYIQLAICKIKECAKNNEMNISSLQSVTDYLLAFWGSISERVNNENILSFLIIGKKVEYIDMHIRFDYPFDRIYEAYDSMERRSDSMAYNIFDPEIQSKLNVLISSDLYDHTEEYKSTFLSYLNRLIVA